MFTKTRLTLTAWYLLIIMLISGAFSLVLYREAQIELQRSLRLQTLRYQREQGLFLPPGVFLQIDDELSTELENRIKAVLLLVNAGILVFSGAAGYFLAGKTLRPIEKMVDDQKQFVADASHELRTPITAMKTEIEVALRDQKMSLLSAKQLLRSNLEETNKMESLSNYLLSLSKYQANNRRLLKEPTNLTETVKTSVDRLSPKIRQKRLKLSVKLKPITLMASPESLVELFSIIIDNAVKYSLPGGKISISVERVTAGALVTIKDTGVGIAQKDLPHVFDRFYRADTSRNKSKIDGYGLGLAIAKEIVDLHHGNISVESEVGKGTVFKIRL